jgi:S1-C subfamily serine protease
MKVETVTEHMLFSTVRLEADVPTGTSTGTGFIFSYRPADTDHLFIVTNKHVIAD